LTSLIFISKKKAKPSQATKLMVNPGIKSFFERAETHLDAESKGFYKYYL